MGTFWDFVRWIKTQHGAIGTVFVKDQEEILIPQMVMPIGGTSPGNAKDGNSATYGTISLTATGEQNVALTSNDLGGPIDVSLSAETIATELPVEIKTSVQIAKFLLDAGDVFIATAAGNATHTCGAAGEVWHVGSIVYEEKGAATPAVTVVVGGVNYTGTVTVTASVSTVIPNTGFYVAGDTALAATGGAAGDEWSITARRLYQ